MENTRDKILEKSLILFSKNGYAGTSIRDIAKEVEIRESSIYKHFESKQSILDEIIQWMQSKIRNVFFMKVDNTQENSADRYKTLTYEQTCEIAWRMFELYTKDYYVSAYRKLLMREQFNNEKLAENYDYLFLSGVIQNQQKIFAGLMKENIFRQGNPELLATQFYGVIYSLFQLYDCHPQDEEKIKKLLLEHIEAMRNFYVLQK